MAHPVRVFRRRAGLFLGLLIVVGCGPAPGPAPTIVDASPAASPVASAVPSPSASARVPGTPGPPAAALGAGFRFSTYGPPTDPGPRYWDGVGRKMADRFPGAAPQAIWIVGNFAGSGPLLTFPGSHPDLRIHFSPRDTNEDALDLFDTSGLQVWLQVEPGDAPVDELIHVMLDRYGHHPSVIGVGVDVEWFRSDGTPEGEAISDADAKTWVAAARQHRPDYRVFLKHWEAAMMPATERDGLFFVDDSQQFPSADAMVREFAAWGRSFAGSPVGFQFGYPADRVWWETLSDPPGELGRRIMGQVPNTAGLFWVDFTVLDVFPPD